MADSFDAFAPRLHCLCEPTFEWKRQDFWLCWRNTFRPFLSLICFSIFSSMTELSGLSLRKVWKKKKLKAGPLWDSLDQMNKRNEWSWMSLESTYIYHIACSVVPIVILLHTNLMKFFRRINMLQNSDRKFRMRSSFGHHRSVDTIYLEEELQVWFLPIIEIDFVGVRRTRMGPSSSSRNDHQNQSKRSPMKKWKSI